jgi:hypothetical protein
VQIPKSRRDEDEVRAFHNFVVQARLLVIPESIQKRDPPEPDILCRMKNGEQLAFEIVEICHRQNSAFLAGAFPLGDLIEKSYQDLPTEIKTRSDERFANRPLSFEFRSEASRNQIGAKLPGILSELADQPSNKDEDWVFSNAARKVLLSVRHRGRVDTAGRPYFNLAGSFTPDVVVVETVMSKLRKTYATPHPIELVAYFGGFAWGDSRDWIQPLQNALDAAGLGPFRRIWVLGWSKIEFVLPSLE